VGSSRRITVALAGLVLLVLAGWFVRDLVTDDTTCNGKKVEVINAGYRLRTGIMTVSVPITASACFPI